MRLRKQLFFVSLITLIVPWAGCQYVKEVDKTLRQGQSQALTATARAVAARLGSDANSVIQLRRYIAPANSTSIYVHPLRSDISPDGYDEEWLDGEYSLQTFYADPRGSTQDSAQINEQVKTQLVAGYFGSSFFMYFRIWDEEYNYYSPSQASPLSSDYIQLSLESEIGETRQLVIYSSAPGSVHVARLLANGNSATEHRVKGQWLEWESGYQVELQLPLQWSERRIAFKVEGLTINGQHYRVGNQQSAAAPPPVVSVSKQISSELEVFVQPGMRLGIAALGTRYVASNGQLLNSGNQTQQHGFIKWFYETTVGDQSTPEIDSPTQTGQFDTPEPSLALQNQESHGWYQQHDRELLRVSVPIYDFSNEREIIGAVVADQSVESLSNMTNSAFDKLLIYSVLVSLIAAAVFLAYASWLSIRIRRLSHAAAGAVSDSGKINEDFLVYSSKDEIGDLSRSYSQLLARLREYTNYLRTLSSKLSHELRTPLAIVKTSLDNLEHEELSKQALTYAERASEGTSRLSNILNAMSAASRVEQAIGAAELEVIPCDELLRNLKEAYSDVYKNVQFSLRFQEDKKSLSVLGSGELLVQMLDKLVDNAADFCPTGGLIELGLYRYKENIVITVRNEGPPLPKNMLGQLFNSMVSVRDTEAPARGAHHLGLGLYIVRLIADFHRGEVQGYNVSDNSGVIFEIRLPAA